jgi:hypothetical protein
LVGLASHLGQLRGGMGCRASRYEQNVFCFLVVLAGHPAGDVPQIQGGQGGRVEEVGAQVGRVLP